MPYGADQSDFATGTKTAAAAVTITGTAAEVIAAGTRRCCYIQPVGGDIYIGKTDAVTTSTGIKLVDGTIFKDEDSADAWYAISGSSISTRKLIIT